MVYINENDKNKKQTLNNDNNLKKLSLLLSTAKVTNSFLLSSLNSNCNNTINDALSKTTLTSEKISREIDQCNHIEDLKNIAKSYVKLNLAQLELFLQFDTNYNINKKVDPEK